MALGRIQGSADQPGFRHDRRGVVVSSDPARATLVAGGLGSLSGPLRTSRTTGASLALSDLLQIRADGK